jgi:two-component system sensor histidine kinase MprB
VFSKKARVKLPPAAFGGETGVAQLVQSNGKRIRSIGNGPLLPLSGPAELVASGRRAAVMYDQTVRGVHLRVFAQRGPDGDVLQVARTLTDVDHTLNRLAWILALVSIAGVGLAAGLGVLVARGTLGPVRRLSHAAEDVATTQDLDARLPAEGRDELATLGASFNTMLGALSASRAAQRQLVADASHELRTPLTSARTNVALLERAPDLDDTERTRVVGQLGEQLSELTVLVDDLVDLARDPRLPEEEPEDVRLDLLAQDVVRSAERHAPDREVRLVSEPCVVTGLPGRLDRALRNLVDNAIKHSPAGSPVEVSVRDGVVSVRDHGSGIAAEDMPHVFDRFYRAATARGLPGSGLGLAIVRQVADAHGGTVTARDAPGGGALLTLALPASPTS